MQMGSFYCCNYYDCKFDLNKIIVPEEPQWGGGGGGVGSTKYVSA